MSIHTVVRAAVMKADSDSQLSLMVSSCPGTGAGSMAEEEGSQQVKEVDVSGTNEPIPQHQEVQQHQQPANEAQEWNPSADNDPTELQPHQLDDTQHAVQLRHQLTGIEMPGQKLPIEARAAQRPQQPADDTDSNSSASECIICFTPYDGIFKLPKLLRCGHTFCLECLARINVSSDVVTSLNCPICRDITRLPARRGLPALDNNQDILEQLPQELRPTRSVRFSRKKGLLYVKNVPSQPSPLPKSLQVSTVSLSLDVGRPPPRVRVPPSFGRGSWLFYTTVAIAILLTVAVVMVGVYIFFIVPSSANASSTNSSTSYRPPQVIHISHPTTVSNSTHTSNTSSW